MLSDLAVLSAIGAGLFIWWLPATAATYVAAGRLGVSKRGWALVPLAGDTATLARCARVSPWVALLHLVPLWGLIIVPPRLWRNICEDSAQPGWLGRLTVIAAVVPLFGAVPMWVIVAKLPRRLGLR